MKTVEKQVLQKKTFYIAKDGKEFDNILDCRRHERNLAESDAQSRFEFTYRDDYEAGFTAVYHADMKDAFAEDLSTIINSRWESTGMLSARLPNPTCSIMPGVPTSG